jgi:hypothetical protein
MRARLFPIFVAALAAVAAIIVPAVSAKAPKAGTGLAAQASLSPLEDQVQFLGSVSSKQRGCALRTIEIRRPAGNVLLDTFQTTEPIKVGKVWSTAGDGDFHPIAGYVTRGESLVAIAPQKKLKKGGKVVAVCKPGRKGFTVP